MADIFISYKREDQEQSGRVIPIVKALEAEGFDVFYDVEIPPGATWEEVLQSKINAAKVVIVLWSEASIQSDWVKEEAEIAKNANKLIPVFLEQVSPPFGFSRIEGANLTGWTGDFSNPEWKNLLRALHARISQPEGQRRPDIRSVPIPVEAPPLRKSGGGLGRFLMAGAGLAILLAAVLFGHTMLQDQNNRSSVTGPDRAENARSDSDLAALEKEKQAFSEAMDANTVESYRGFLAAYPTSQYGKDARDRMNALIQKARLESSAAYDEARRANTVEAYRAFIARFPNSEQADSAQTLLDRLLEQLAAEPQPVNRARLDEDCLKYSGQFNVRENNGLYQLIDTVRNATPLAARGTNARAEIGSALKVIQEFDLREQCYVDRPRPPLSYWVTSEGQLPAQGASRLADACFSFTPETVSVKVRGGMHMVYGGDAVMLRYSSPDAANRAADIIKAYSAQRFCRIGDVADPTMRFLTR